MDDDDRRFHDLVYEAWRRGMNPDLVDKDAYDAATCNGYYPDEIVLDMVYPRAAKADDQPIEKEG